MPCCAARASTHGLDSAPLVCGGRHKNGVIPGSLQNVL